MPHAIWTGSISLGLVNIPVKMVLAAKDRMVEFHNMHSKCKTPIQHKRWCPHCKKEVPWTEIVKGYKIGPNQYAVITKQELEAIRLKSTKAIEIVQFTNLSEIDPLLISHSYYLIPQEGGEKAYTLFHDVLAQTGKVAIGKVVFRSKESLVAIRPYQNCLVLTVLHYKDEIVPIDQLEELKRLVIVRPEELKLARTLVEKLSSSFDIKRYKDKYLAEVKKLVKEKVEGKQIVGPPLELKPTPSKDLMKALKASVEKIKKKRK